MNTNETPAATAGVQLPFPPTMNAYDDALRDRVLALPCQHRLEGNDPDHPDRLTFSEGFAFLTPCA